MNDPVQSHENAIQASVHWIELALVGSIASAVAVIAVGWFGLMMLNGRLSPRRGVQLVLGCFIIFGASTVAAGIARALTSNAEQPVRLAPLPPVAMAPIPVVQRPTPAAPYDPYAGAALPPRR